MFKMTKNKCKKTKRDLEKAESKLKSEMSAFLLSPSQFSGRNISKLKQEIIKLKKKHDKC